MSENARADLTARGCADRPWHEVASTQWALRSTSGTSRVLMRRHCDPFGHDSAGNSAPWSDVAVFASYNDADHVLRVLQESAR